MASTAIQRSAARRSGPGDEQDRCVPTHQRAARHPAQRLSRESEARRITQSSEAAYRDGVKVQESGRTKVENEARPLLVEGGSSRVLVRERYRQRRRHIPSLPRSRPTTRFRMRRSMRFGSPLATVNSNGHIE